nr:FAD/NAD(P)-binding oxidoreductase [Tessaracoccus coleopterorum]
MEIAAVARTKDVPVTVVVREDRILRQLGDLISDRFLQAHRDHGVEFALNSTIASIDGAGERGTVEAVTLHDGRRIDASRLLIGVGAEPRVELAREAGLAIDNGVLVDDSLRSSRPEIVAVGDIANAENAWVGHRIRVEHWAMALTQPEVAARTLVGTRPTTEGRRSSTPTSTTSAWSSVASSRPTRRWCSATPTTATSASGCAPTACRAPRSTSTRGRATRSTPCSAQAGPSTRSG